MFLESNLFIFNLTTTKRNICRTYVNMSIKEVIESMTADRWKEYMYLTLTNLLRIHSQLQKIWNECFVVVAEKVHEKYKEKKKKKKTFCYFYGIKQIIFTASFTV